MKKDKERESGIEMEGNRGERQRERQREGNMEKNSYLIPIIRRVEAPPGLLGLGSYSQPCCALVERESGKDDA